MRRIASLSVIVAAALAAAGCATGQPTLSASCASGAADSIEGDWVLARMNGALPPTRGELVTLVADANALSGGMTCNSYNTLGVNEGVEGAHYRIEGGRLVAANGILRTAMLCLDAETGESNDASMEFDGAYMAILDNQPHVARQADTLCLYADDGRSLEFRRQVAETAP